MNIAHYRKVDPKALRHELLGDLDSIVMKALEKNRTRRYETASALAMDLQRHLNQELVVARPPSRLYRAKKSIRRHKRLFVATAAVGIALLLAVTVSTWLALKATAARHTAERAAAEERANRIAAESRTAITKARNLFAEENYAEAEKIVFSLPDDFIQKNADDLEPVFRALGHWNGGQHRWKQCAACYDMFLLGPACRVALEPNRKIGNVGWQLSLTWTGMNGLPFDIAYLEYGSVLAWLGDRKRYEQLCDAGVARYRDIEREGLAFDWLNEAGERMLHGCLLLPVQPRHRVAFCKWSLLIEKSKPQEFLVHHATALALFEFRRGHYEEALQQAKVALSLDQDPTHPGHTRDLVIMGLAYAALNEREAAQAVLAKAHEQIDPKFAGDWHMGAYGDLWADWLIDGVLLKEADGMLAASSSPNAFSSSQIQAGSPSWDEAMATASKELEGFNKKPAGAKEGAGE